MPTKPELAVTIGLEFFLAGAAFLIGGPVAAAVVAVMGLIMMAVGLWYRHRQLETDASNSSMSWADLEARFKELQQKEIRQSHDKRIPGLLDAVTFEKTEAEAAEGGGTVCVRECASPEP